MIIIESSNVTMLLMFYLFNLQNINKYNFISSGVSQHDWNASTSEETRQSIDDGDTSCDIVESSKTESNFERRNRIQDILLGLDIEANAMRLKFIAQSRYHSLLQLQEPKSIDEILPLTAGSMRAGLGCKCNSNADL